MISWWWWWCWCDGDDEGENLWFTSTRQRMKTLLHRLSLYTCMHISTNASLRYYIIIALLIYIDVCRRKNAHLNEKFKCSDFNDYMLEGENFRWDQFSFDYYKTARILSGLQECNRSFPPRFKNKRCTHLYIILQNTFSTVCTYIRYMHAMKLSAHGNSYKYMKCTHSKSSIIRWNEKKRNSHGWKLSFPPNNFFVPRKLLTNQRSKFLKGIFEFFESSWL